MFEKNLKAIFEELSKFPERFVLIKKWHSCFLGSALYTSFFDAQKDKILLAQSF